MFQKFYFGKIYFIIVDTPLYLLTVQTNNYNSLDIFIYIYVLSLIHFNMVGEEGEIAIF
jgi:hypothetical protein